MVAGRPSESFRSTKKRLVAARPESSRPMTNTPEVPQPVMSALLASGFPFQTAVAQVVRQVSPVSWVRSRKGFTATGKDLGDRTIFVVAATALPEFLGKLDMI